ncbi:hypothetical protein EFL81_10180 [Weissella confusa]|uniref:hypothetical protein n=1 Tax=Weissella confusa TaxID=1583 RepID=UPI00223B3032|nr:hypothetical protein [Weissella confusa]MCS9991197.1 hypothetical protein [Weissella confusa]MCS9997172.1 hypothetical protein [Weissella confusa]
MFTEEDIITVERRDDMLWYLKTDEPTPEDSYPGDGGNLFYADSSIDGINEAIKDFIDRPDETTTIDSFTLYEYGHLLYAVWNY